MTMLADAAKRLADRAGEGVVPRQLDLQHACDRDAGRVDTTGPDTGVAYSIWYALSSADPGATEIVFIGEVGTETKFVAPGRSESTHYFAFYLPSQDHDPADGFPDEGETPACSAPVPLYTLDTRLPAP